MTVTKKNKWFRKSVGLRCSTAGMLLCSKYKNIQTCIDIYYSKYSRTVKKFYCTWEGCKINCFSSQSGWFVTVKGIWLRNSKVWRGSFLNPNIKSNSFKCYVEEKL